MNSFKPQNTFHFFLSPKVSLKQEPLSSHLIDQHTFLNIYVIEQKIFFLFFKSFFFTQKLKDCFIELIQFFLPHKTIERDIFLPFNSRQV